MSTVYQQYEQFLRAKAIAAVEGGFEAQNMHPGHFPHQQVSIQWAARRGAALVASSFGLGKTRVQIELLRQAHRVTGKPVLEVCPLGVKHQFMHLDGPAMGVTFEYVRTDAEVADALQRTPYLITNYERLRDGNISEASVKLLGGVALDEAAILGNLGTETEQVFKVLFRDTPYRWCATATPAPNDYRQLLYFGEFLGVMDASQGLTRWFERNPDKAGDLRLMPHMAEEFWLWVASWCLFVTKPSDLGFDDTGYDIPPFDLHWHRLTSDHKAAWDLTDSFGQAYLFKDTAAGVQQAMKEKRSSLPDRIAEALATVGSIPADEQVVVWCHLNDEQDALERGLKAMGVTFSSIRGSMQDEDKEQQLFKWINKEARVLLSKPEMLGAGPNFQQAHHMIFCGVTFKFRDTIQAIHRQVRFGQLHRVQIHFIHTDAEDHVVSVFMDKWSNHDALVANMRQIVQEYGLTNESLRSEMRRSIGVTRQQEKGSYYTLTNNDCVLELMAMADNSIDEIVTSIPFGNHYEYVASLNDFGHNQTDADFWLQMDFLIPHLLRVLKPGRMAAIHTKDRLLYSHQTPHGMMEVDYFTHDTARAFRKHGFISYGEIFIPTDVVRENNSTYRLGWTEACKDGTKMGVGLCEKVLLFRKPPTDRSRSYADEPVVKSKAAYSRGRWQIDAHQHWRSNGETLHLPQEDPTLLYGMSGSQVYRWHRDFSRNNPYDYEQHVAFNEAMGERLPARFMMMPPQAPPEYADSVWTDVLFMNTLNMAQARRRIAKHVCLAKGSLVLTDNGYKPIQDVQVGDMVLTHKGRWRPVLVMQNTGVRPVVNLSAQGVPGLKLTPDHKLWARKSNWVRERDGAERVEPDWIPAEDMGNGYVNLKLPPEQSTSLTHRELWMLGRWIADGHVGARGEFVVSIGPDKISEFERMAGDWAGTSRELSAIQIRLKDLPAGLRAALLQCGRGADNKQLPAWAMSLPPDDAKSLLDGYLSGDGCFVESKQRWMASSVSKPLLLGLAMLVQRTYGVIASVYPGRSAGTTTIEGREVNTKQDWILAFRISEGRRTRPFILDDGAWKRVKSVEPAGEIETWNLRVADDNSYTAEGCIVKNCPFPIDIVQRLIRRFSNEGETILDPFSGIGTTAMVAVQMGRSGVGIELNPLYWQESVKYCYEAEVKRNSPSLFDLIEEDATEEDVDYIDEDALDLELAELETGDD